MKKHLLFLLALSLGSVQPKAFLGEHQAADPAARVTVDTKDIELVLEGRVREEFCYFDRLVSLRDDFHDSLHFFRNKMHLGAYVEYGRQQYGEPAITAELQMCAYNYWDHPTQYAKLSEENIALSKGAFRDEVTLGSDHTHFGEIPALYQDEAWVNIDLDMLTPVIQIPLSLRIGYFPYKIGRGVSLGDYHEGSISFMGWQDKTIESSATQSPQGILFIAEFSESVQLDLYYSKWRSYSTTPSLTREGIRAPRLSLDIEENDPKTVERGTKADRELFATRLQLDTASKSGMTHHVEPYLVYVHAPEQRVEMAGDADTRLGTYGVMIESQGEKFRINAEVAGQFGRQIMHALDRNTQEMERDKTTGSLNAVYTHLLQQGSLTDKQPVSDTVNDVVWHHINRNAALPDGTKLRDLDGTDLQVDGKTVSNSSYPFLAKNRFRNEYRIDLRGYMAMLDMQYFAMNGRLRLGTTGGIISGDAYPYNNEENKTYHGFLPLRDQNFDGEYVKSFSVLHARKFPRPLDMADTKMYAFNHDEDCANMRYVGASIEWLPLSNPRELVVVPCVFSFWQDVPPHKWDKTATRTFDNATYDAVYAACQSKLGFTGAATTDLASRHLGIETSLAVIWNVAPSCQVNIAASAFFPGKLYRDTHGQPNRNTRRIKPDGSYSYDSLGSATMLGLNARLTFAF